MAQKDTLLSHTLDTQYRDRIEHAVIDAIMKTSYNQNVGGAALRTGEIIDALVSVIALAIAYSRRDDIENIMPFILARMERDIKMREKHFRRQLDIGSKTPFS